MGAEEALDRVYESSSDPESQKELYDDWAASYERDLRESGYATPARLAELLAEHVSPGAEPILDFGCGTGMSGQALADVGFTTIDGADLSSGMLEQAKRSGAYRQLWQLTAGELEVTPGAYRAVVACGVISAGAAPASALALVASAVAPGDLLAFSFNDHTIGQADYMAALDSLLADEFEELAAVRGVHIASRSSESIVYVLRRRS